MKFTSLGLNRNPVQQPESDPYRRCPLPTKCNEIESRSSQTIRIRSYEPSKHDGVSRCVCVSELVMLKNWKSKPYLWNIHRYVNVRKIKCVGCKSNTKLIHGTCISWMYLMHRLAVSRHIDTTYKHFPRHIPVEIPHVMRPAVKPGAAIPEMPCLFVLGIFILSLLQRTVHLLIQFLASSCQLLVLEHQYLIASQHLCW